MSVRRLSRLHLVLGLPATLLAGVTSVAAFAEEPIPALGINSDQLAGVIALAVGVFSGLSTFVDANKRASLHRAAWARYEAIRHKALLVSELELKADDAAMDPATREATVRLGQLTAELNETNSTAP